MAKLQFAKVRDSHAQILTEKRNKLAEAAQFYCDMMLKKLEEDVSQNNKQSIPFGFLMPGFRSKQNADQLTNFKKSLDTYKGLAEA